TLFLPYDGYAACKFHANPPYWYCIRQKDWDEFDRKIQQRDLPCKKDFTTAKSSILSGDSAGMAFERFVAMYELAPAAVPKCDYYFCSSTNMMPLRLFEYLLAHNFPIEDVQDVLFSYAKRDSLDYEEEKKLEALLKAGYDPCAVDSDCKTVIDHLNEQWKTSDPETKIKVKRRADLFRKYGAKTFKELIRQNQVTVPILVDAAPELMDVRLRPLFKQMRQRWDAKGLVAFYLSYPGCVPAGIPALIAVEGKTLKKIKIFEQRQGGVWSASPCRNWFVPNDVWYLIVTPKGVMLPGVDSPLPTMVPAIRHITHGQYELWFCGDVNWSDDMDALTTLFQLPKECFSSTYPEGGVFRYGGNVERFIYPARETNAQFIDNYKKISAKYDLPGSWKMFTVNYGIPCNVAVFEYNTRRFGELHGVEVNGFQMIVYPHELFKNAASDLPCPKRKRGYWNEIGPENKHGFRISILYGDHVSPEILQKLVGVAQELK
ncbi:MAG: hypothetical protein PHI35_06815, partial [Victivallaceae bacterium]|nr:hypothetical protein [Victivallaceae bacterium]